MKTKFTKGEWDYYPVSPKTFRVKSNIEHRRDIIEVRSDDCHSNRCSVEEAEANARLIAAAPELLDACEKGLPELKQYLNDVGHDPSVGIDASSLIDAIECMAQAIKKATQP